MSEKEYTTESEQMENPIPKNVRYTYFGSRVEIDGIRYPVVAAIPFGIISRQLPTAKQSLLKLIKEK